MDVEEHVTYLPCNDWPDDPRMKQVGEFTRRMLTDNTRGIVWKMLQNSGLSPVEIDELVVQCKSEFQDTSLRLHWPL